MFAHVQQNFSNSRVTVSFIVFQINHPLSTDKILPQAGGGGKGEISCAGRSPPGGAGQQPVQRMNRDGVRRRKGVRGMRSYVKVTINVQNLSNAELALQKAVELKKKYPGANISVRVSA